MMLNDLIQKSRKAVTLSECCRNLVEVTAYVMQTGPRGGRYYHDDKGTRHYRELEPGAAPAAPRSKSKEVHDREWRDARGIPGGRDTSVGDAMWRLFGETSPSPEEFAGMFSAQGINAEINSVSGHGSSVSVRYTVKDQDGTEIGTMSRDFYDDPRGRGPHVHHSYFTLEEEAQGGGRGGAMFGKALETYKKIGIKIASVDAAITVGPYAWARFGFQPNSSDMQSLRTQFTDFLQQPPIGMNLEQAAAVTSKHGKDLHSMSGALVQVKHLNPKTGQPEWKTIKAGKDFLLYSRGGGTRSWSGEADLRDPKVVERWEAQAEKGVKARKKTIAEGKQNSRNGSPNAVSRELRELGDRGLYRLVDRASFDHISRQAPGAWNFAIDALKKAAEENPSKRATFNDMLKRLAPFHRRVVSRHSYTSGGREEFTREQQRARNRARTSAPTPPEPIRPAPPQRLPPTGGAGVSPASQAAAKARTVARRAARRAAAPSPPAVPPPVPQPAISPQAQDLIRKGKDQVARVSAKQTPEQRAAKHGTTVGQERRIDRIADRKTQSELLKRREKRALARHQGAAAPEFIPIRTYTHRIRAMERARIRPRR